MRIVYETIAFLAAVILFCALTKYAVDFFS